MILFKSKAKTSKGRFNDFKKIILKNNCYPEDRFGYYFSLKYFLGKKDLTSWEHGSPYKLWTHKELVKKKRKQIKDRIKSIKEDFVEDLVEQFRILENFERG